MVIDSAALKTARKEAEQELKVFTDDMDLPAFLAAAETFCNRSCDMEESVGILRTWMFARTPEFNRYFTNMILQKFWRNISGKIRKNVIEHLEEVLTAAGYSHKTTKTEPEIRWYKINPDKLKEVVARISETYGEDCIIEKTSKGGLNIICKNDSDWHEIARDYPESTAIRRESKVGWVLEE